MASAADEFCQIDIAAELMRVASEALPAVDRVIRQAERLRVHMAKVKETLLVFRIAPA